VRYTTNHGASGEYVHKYAKKDTLLKKYDIGISREELFDPISL
jgi:hypothetical protein